jgi:hypothetical protein
MTFNQKIYTCYWIIKHKLDVFYYILKLCWALIKRGIKHDLSKFSKEEFEYIYNLSVRGKNVKFGSKEYYKLVDSVKSAKLSHSQKNRHHFEYHNSVNDMDLIDIIEVLCDWLAATKRQNGNIYKSIIINQKRYNLSTELTNFIKNTITNEFYKSRITRGERN